MMSRTSLVLLLALMMAADVKLSGQQKSGTKPAAKPFVPPVYLGESNYKGGPIQKEKFNAFLKQGLSSHDSLGNYYKIVGFDFTYAERKVYEDSIGNLMKLTDLISQHYPGNMIGKDLGTDADTSAEGEVFLSLYQRVKPGDTVYFDHIQVTTIGKNILVPLPDSIPVVARGIRCEIVK